MTSPFASGKRMVSSAALVTLAAFCTLSLVPAAGAQTTPARPAGSDGAASTATSRSPGKSHSSCAATYRNARKLERAGRLQKAQTLLMECARPACGRFLEKECGARYALLEADIPSVVPDAVDEKGQPVADVQVAMDGEVLTSRIDGRALPVDPGLHEFRFTDRSGLLATVRAMVLQGQRNRPISVELRPAGASAPGVTAAAQPEATAIEVTATPDHALESALVAAPAPPAAPGSRRSYLAPIMLTAVGAAGIGGYVLATWWGRDDNRSLERCAPNCRSSSVEHVRRLYLAGNVSLGVGAVALAAASWMFLRPGPAADPELARSARAGYQLDLRPTAGGGLAALSGGF